MDTGVIEMKLDSGNSNDRYSLIESRVAAGGEAATHVHEDEAEMFYVCRGELWMSIGNHEIYGREGAFAYIPPGLAHSFKNTGNSDVVFLNPFVPPGREQLFRDGGTLRAMPEPRPEFGKVELARFEQALRKHRVIINPTNAEAWGESDATVFQDGPSLHFRGRRPLLSFDQSKGHLRIDEYRCSVNECCSVFVEANCKADLYLAKGEGIVDVTYREGRVSTQKIAEGSFIRLPREAKTINFTAFFASSLLSFVN